jgi:hypothetical protein
MNIVLVEEVGGVVNGTVTKTDDPGALAERLAIVEARLEIIAAWVGLDVPKPGEPLPEPKRPMSARWLGVQILIGLIILASDFYFNVVSADPELGRQNSAAIANALCVVRHGLPVRNPCVW